MNIEIKPLPSSVVSQPKHIEYNIHEATVDVADNKLVLSKEAVKALDSTAGDRIAINYWTVNSSETFPVIGKASCFSDSTDGNRLTKSNTVSYRGVQRNVLLEYGKKFYITPFNNYFKMCAIEEKIEDVDFSEELNDLNKLE